MHRTLTPLLPLCLLSGLLAACGSGSAPASAQGEAAAWAFSPARDEFKADALLDLRSLNEKTAGESGFVRATPAGDFVLGSGRAARFWAVNTNVGREKPFRPRPHWSQQEPDLDYHARFLAKRGVNMVRLHAHLNPDLKANPQAKLTDINTAERDWIWRVVAAMKKQGIYTTVSPYWANTMQLSEAWDIPGGAKQGTHGLLFIDQKVQEGYRAWMHALLAEKNPYTGIPLSQDPALAIIQVQNEDSLLFWTVNGLQGEQRRRLGQRFAEWVKKKHGSLEAANRAWENDRLPKDDAAAGVLDFHNIWEMTQERRGGRARRLADQLQFWTETMHAFNRGIVEYLRQDLGCKQLVNAGNWKTADAARLGDAERWSYTAADVVGVNRYYTGIHEGPNEGWAIVNGDRFTSPSALKNPLDWPLHVRQVRGLPTMVTESSWVFPHAYATEGPFLVSAYQSLTGLDAFYWFATGEDGWTPPQSANGYLPSQQKWFFGSPDVLGTFPAAALAFRQGYVQQAPPSTEQRPLQDLWDRKPAAVTERDGYDPNRDASRPAGGATETPAAFRFLLGPVETTFGGVTPAAPDGALSGVSLVERQVRSSTGQINLDWGRGLCRVDTPQYQGAAGFLKEQPSHALSDVTIESQNEYGAVSVVSLDTRPLKSSRRVLVQVGTRSRPTDWREKPVSIKLKNGPEVPGFQVESFGRAPWRVDRARVTVRLRNPSLTKATVLDPNGRPAGTAALARDGGAVRLTFPGDALYVVLEAGS